ncbi:leucine-rich repeat-containing protein 74B-like [Ostrinia nubilalis]|uniref:leucine-rich repeat-containing protein 74B-like n=1 Tax=Ostrinia nubilalis TaxID=29057 RepID=UPI0030825875
MSSSGSEVTQGPVMVERIYQAVISSSSSDPPMEEWSSLFDIVPPDSPKMVLFKQGLFDPGSGEVCAKYIPLSDSDVLRHPYYAYPGIKDPGIEEALFGSEKKKVYNTNGQELYLDLCEEMHIIPIRGFHRGLLEDAINLRYYGVNPVGIRAMCLSLSYNNHVRRLDLTSNFLDNDACYHLGVLLGENATLQELILSGCKLKPEGLRRIVVRLAYRSMDLLDLSRNDFGDQGFEYLAAQITRGAVIKRLSLSYNHLGVDTAVAFAAAIEGNKSTTHLDLSWNKFYPVKGASDLLRQLGDSRVLTELYLSWNGLTVGMPLRKVLMIPTLRLLDLSNNRLSTAAAKAICARLHMAEKLHTLDLSHNPINPADALLILQKMTERAVKLQNLLMDDIVVNKEFAALLREVLSLKYRSKTKITHGKVIRDYALMIPDMREIVMRRLFYLTDATEKCDLDIALYFLKMYKEKELLQPRELMKALKVSGAPLDEGLIEEFSNAFPGPKLEKGGKTVTLSKVVEFVRRLWPEKQLPPTPPPPPEPEKKKKGKGKKKK